jgi:inorganic pyrophosphatase
MDISRIPAGRNPPSEINAVIEIPQGGVPVKYEMDKESGAMFVDRFLHTAMFYPGNYGFIPRTLSEDGDPVDVLVVTQVPVVPGAVIRCRPVGVLLMTDEHGGDEKIIAVPTEALHPFFNGVRSCEDLPQILRDQIAHFFQHYKDLEPGKWVKVVRWDGPAVAERMIVEAMKRAAAPTAREAFEAIGGDDRAARAEADRQAALAEITEVAERYVRLRSAIVLLQWAIDRYRREKQAPMLKRAGELFAILTCGSFETLQLEFDEHDNVQLAGIRKGGRQVPVSGMSSGTADQLYLASARRRGRGLSRPRRVNAVHRG